jgi:hypothetical protein
MVKDTPNGEPVSRSLYDETESEAAKWHELELEAANQGINYILRPGRTVYDTAGDLAMAGLCALYDLDGNDPDYKLLIHGVPSHRFLDSFLAGFDDKSRHLAFRELLEGIERHSMPDEKQSAQTTKKDAITGHLGEFREAHMAFSILPPDEAIVFQSSGDLQSSAAWLRLVLERYLDERFDKINLLHEGGDIKQMGMDYELYRLTCAVLDRAQLKLANSPYTSRVSGEPTLKTGFSGQVFERIRKDIVALKSHILALLT